MSSSRRTFAIVPAAGVSRRMGCPKLLLPWPTGMNPDGRIIDQVLRAWTSSRVTATVVVVRMTDKALVKACQAWPVELLCATPPPRDMKASIQLALDSLQAKFQPQPMDRCFIAPADLPGLHAALIDQLISAPSESSEIVVPLFGDKVGHPALLPWRIVQEVQQLGEDEGMNRITERHSQRRVRFDATLRVDDVDTVAEYEFALSRWKIR